MVDGTFSYTIIYVPDVEQGLAFYERAFALKRRFIADDGTYGELQTDGVTLAFAAESLAEANLQQEYEKHRADAPPFAYELGFTTDQVDKLVQQSIDAGASLLASPKEKPWGQTVAYVRDPNGVLIEICTPMSS